MSDWSQEPEAQRWIADVQENMVPRMQASGAVVSIQAGKTDVKHAVELGMALLLDKPLILAVTPGVEVPERLRRAADDVIVFDMTEPEATAQRVRDAMDRIIE
jgi:nucleoside 2-deoxyribosyltransferase